MKNLRFRFTGSGYMGRTHSEARRRIDNTEVVAIWGSIRAQGLAQKYGGVCEPTLAALMGRSDLHATVMATPHHLHVEQAVLALETGRNALVEKPMATLVADCDCVIAAAVTARRVLAISYQQRFWPHDMRARKSYFMNANSHCAVPALAGRPDQEGRMAQACGS